MNACINYLSVFLARITIHKTSLTALRLFTILIIGISLLGVSSAVESRPLLLPVPSVSLTIPAAAMIGSSVTVTATFDNAHAVDTGYGPYIDVFLPLSGVDGPTTPANNDGLSFVSGSYGGLGLSPQISTCTAGTTGLVHPLTKLTYTCPAAPVGMAAPFTWQMLVFTLPFGSFVPEQPPAPVVITAQMSNLADLGTTLPVYAGGGFMFGADPLDNPGGDPPLVMSPLTSASVTPTILTLTKSYNGPEDETATGPNFMRRHTLTVDIANGQTVTNLDVSDFLPSNMQFTRVVSTSPSATCGTQPAAATPGGTLICTFPTVTGGTGTSDAVVTFEFFFNYLDSVGAGVLKACGNDAPAANNAAALGDWTPIDTRDTGATDNASAGSSGPPNEYLVTAKSIAIQKGSAIVGGGAVAPGARVQYTLNFQVSDFYGFDSVVISDTLSDGQHYDASFTPTLSLNGLNFSLPSQGMNAANFTVTPNYTPVSSPPNDGTTNITFRVSDELVTRGRPNGWMIGGCIPEAGTGGATPACPGAPPYADGPTTGTLVFRTVIQENFTDDFAPGDESVDQGDVMDNTVILSGSSLNLSDLDGVPNPPAVLCSEPDNSAARISIARGSLAKSIYAINGTPGSYGNQVQVAPGDTVTYRFTYNLPTGDVENLHFIDYLPLPVFNATQVTSFSYTGGASAPPAGQAKFGPSDTYYAYYSGTFPARPSLSTNSTQNTVTFTYGDYDGLANSPFVVDILFTVTVRTDPFADQLYLTNQVQGHEGSTNNGAQEATQIIQIVLTEPILQVFKGAVWTNRSGAVFSPAVVGPGTFNGNAASCAARFTNPLNSNGLLSTPVGSSVSGLDAGDEVMFAVIVENLGTGINGAFDVALSDALPAGLTYVDNSLCVTNGAGAAINYNGTDNDFFGTGIILTDPGPTTGAIGPYHATSGANIAVLTFKAAPISTDTFTQVLTNTARLNAYAGAEGRENHLTAPLTDSANVTIASPTLTKSIVSTSEVHTAEGTPRNLAVGEIARFRLQVQLPEGSANDVQVVDVLPAGLTFLNDNTAMVVFVCNSSAACITSSSLSGAGLVVNGNETTIASIHPTFVLPDAAVSASAAMDDNTFTTGVDPRFKLGSITNLDVDTTANTNLEYIVIEFNALLDNSAAGSNDHNETRNNTYAFNINGTTSIGSAPAAVQVRVVEPIIPFSLAQNNKTVSPTGGDAGDTVTYSVTFAATSGNNRTDAFNVRIVDNLSALPLDNIVVTPPSSTANCIGVTNNSAGSVVDLTIDQMRPGCSLTVTYTARLTTAVAPGTITNIASLTYTSLPGANCSTSNPTGSATPGTPGTDTGERTGTFTGPSTCSAAPNDYCGYDTAQVLVQASPQKSLIATSEAHTQVMGGVERLAVGEVARYRLQIAWPEGTATNIQFLDAIPAGMQYINNSARVALVSDGNCPTATFTSSSLGSAPWACGNETNVSSITPSFVLPDTAVSTSATLNQDVYNSGTDVYFKLDNLTNDDRDPNSEIIVIEFNARVLNNATSQADVNLDNSFQVINNGTPLTPASNTVTAAVVEPVLSITKTVTTPPNDAGDTVVYTLRVTNTTSGNTAAAAFDLVVTDPLNGYITLLNASDVSWTAPGYATVTNNSNPGGNLVSLAISRLNPGDLVDIVISARVNNTVEAGRLLQNTAAATFTSLPDTAGVPGTCPNAIGANAATDCASGSSGDLTSERNGNGGTNDYRVTNLAQTSINAPAIDKLNVTPASYPVGAAVTYDIRVTLPEGVTTALAVIDNLPPGLEYVSHQVIFDTTTANSILTENFSGGTPASSSNNPTGSGSDFILTFGNVTLPPDASTANNSFQVRLTARVVNEIGNQNGTTLSNLASVRFTDPETGVTTINDPTPVVVTVIEPVLVVTKGASNSTPAFGETVTYTLHVENLGPASTADALDLAMTDVIPAGLTFVGAASPQNGWTVSFTGPNQLNFSVASFPLGSIVDLTYQAIVGSPPAPALSDVLTNNVVLAWTSLPGASGFERTGAGGINDYRTTTNHPVTITGPDIHISKTDGQTQYIPGSAVTYTIVVQNTGNGPVIGLVITDDRPVNEISTWTWTCGVATGGATGCDGAALGSSNFTDTVNMPAGSSITYTVSANTNPAATANLVNTVTATVPTGVTDPTPANNTATDTDTPNPQIDLVASKTDGSLYYIPGQNIVYTIVVSNLGPSNAPSAQVSDAFLTQFSAWTWTCTGTTGTASGCDGAGSSTNPFSDIVNLPANSSITYTVTAAVPSNVTIPITNTVTIATLGGQTDVNPTNNTASDTDTVSPTADLRINKDDGAAIYVPGQSVTYTIVVTNDGPSDISGAIVTDSIPAQALNWTWTCGAAVNGANGCDGIASSTVNFSDTINLPANSSQTYTVAANLRSNASLSLVNTVVVTMPVNSTDPTPGNNSATDTDNPDPRADLSITKTDGSATYVPGTNVVYSVVVTNLGPSDVTGAVINDSMPTIATAWSWVCAAQTGGATGCDGAVSGTAAFSDIVNLPSDAAITYTVTAAIPSTQRSVLVNTATVTMPVGVTETDLTNNTATDTDTANPQADLSIAKDDGSTFYVPLHPVTYTITVTNIGPSSVIGAVVSDTLPTQAVSWAWTCTSQTGGATGCTPATSGTAAFNDTVDLPVGATITYTVTVQIGANPSGSLTNTVQVNPPAGTSDPIPANNTATDSDSLNRPDMSITKSDGGVTASAGSLVTYILNYANIGSYPAAGVVITDSVPPHTTFVPASSTAGWNCTPNNNAGSACTITIGTVATGATGSVQFTVRLNNNFPAGLTQISNTATIADDGSSGVDLTPENNTATEPTPLDAAPDLAIAKDDGTVQVAPNVPLTYTLTIQNIGTQDATGVSVQDTLPPGLIFVSASDGGTNASGTISWPPFNLNAGQSVQRMLTVRVEPNLTGIPTITNTASVSDDKQNGTDTDLSNNITTDTDLVATWSKSLLSTNHAVTLQNNVAIGEMATYQVGLEIAPGQVQSLSLTDILDRGLVFVDCQITAPAGLSAAPVALDQVCAQARQVSTEPNGSTNPADAGRKMVVNFGTVTNNTQGNLMLLLTYQAVVLDSAENLRGVSLNNQAVWNWSTGTRSATAADVRIVEPILSVKKISDVEVVLPGNIVQFTLTISHLPASDSDAYNVTVIDDLPKELTYVPGSLKVISGQAPTSLDVSNPARLKINYDVFADNGQTSVVQYSAKVGAVPDGIEIKNSVLATWTSLPSNYLAPQTTNNALSTERSYRPNSTIDIYAARSQVVLVVPEYDGPKTGFTPGKVTQLNPQPDELAYTALEDMLLEIPSMGIKLPVVGIPLMRDGWDVSWLGSSAGWLQGTAYPGMSGNSLVTAHVYDANGLPGPFVNLGNLKWGAPITITVSGKRYRYEVQQVSVLSPNDRAPLKSESRAWLTLLTCRGYDPVKDTYAQRVMVRAVLVKVE